VTSPVVTPTVDRFVTTAGENGCEVQGPIALAHAADDLARLVLAYAEGGDIAYSDDDLTRALALDDAVTAAGGRVLSPTASDWDARLAVAPVGVTGSVLAVAATGTMLLAASPGAPRATSLLPPVHVCIVRADRVVDTFAEAIERVSQSELPSALIWVSGPSRTSDLEMRPTVGVHGPKAVTVVLVD
jgi:L-lactate dehydrogenase complex protein LldG